MQQTGNELQLALVNLVSWQHWKHPRDSCSKKGSLWWNIAQCNDRKCEDLNFNEIHFSSAKITFLHRLISSGGCEVKGEKLGNLYSMEKHHLEGNHEDSSFPSKLRNFIEASLNFDDRFRTSMKCSHKLLRQKIEKFKINYVVVGRRFSEKQANKFPEVLNYGSTWNCSKAISKIYHQTSPISDMNF